MLIYDSRSLLWLNYGHSCAIRPLHNVFRKNVSDKGYKVSKKLFTIQSFFFFISYFCYFDRDREKTKTDRSSDCNRWVSARTRRTGPASKTMSHLFLSFSLWSLVSRPKIFSRRSRPLGVYHKEERDILDNT